MMTPARDYPATVRVCESNGVRAVSLDAATAPTAVAPAAAGDCTTPNNFIPIDEANGFSAGVRVSLGAEVAGQSKQHSVKPDAVRLTAIVTPEHLIWDLSVDVTNTLEATAAAVLDVPRLQGAQGGGLLLLEENHVVGRINYSPKVMEKEQADAAYRQAAASETHSATLSDTSEQQFAVKLDKIPARESATFGLKFIASGGLRSCAEVLADGEAEPGRIADLLVLPGFTSLADAGVPFHFKLLFDQRYTVTLPSVAVLKEEVDALTAQHSPWQPQPLAQLANLLVLGPSLVSGGDPSVAGGGGGCMRSLTYRSAAGLAHGTLLQVRLCEKLDSALVASLGDLSVGAAPPPAAAIDSVDTFEGAYFSQADGARCDASIVQLNVPAKLPGVEPCASPHELYVIVDTSGSTGMRVDDGSTFQEKAKLLLGSILRALPQHVAALRAQGVINAAPATLRLWRFDQSTVREAEVQLSVGSDGSVEMAPLHERLATFRPGGCTNYDSWAAELRACIEQRPAHLHSVLLVTDGGATQRERFVSEIKDIGSRPGVGFFQVDCLGYGPWLDASTVSFLASATGGEALMVEQLSGEAIKKKVVGILARSMLRAASRLTMRVSGGLVLALRGGDSDGPAPTGQRNLLEPGTPYEVPVMAGASLALYLLHPSAAPPTISICGTPLHWPKN